MKLHNFIFFKLLIAFGFISSAYAQTISGGGYHSLSLCSNGTVRAWGRNGNGQLGNGNYIDTNLPVQVAGLTGVISIAGGGLHSLALKSDGTVWAWGMNANGQLGNGNNTTSNFPVQVSGLTGVIAISAGGVHSLALKNDGTVWAWGSNFYGRLGNGTNTDSNVPVQTSSLTGVIAIAGAGFHSLALKSDSTVWAWGYNNNGQLGNGNYTNSNVPVQTLNISKVKAIAGGGRYFSLAVKSDGTVWAWGSNAYGQIGNGTIFTATNVPVQTSSLTGIKNVEAGEYFSVALKNDGTVWNWGRNDFGQLGIGNYTDSSVPVQVSGLAGVSAIAKGEFYFHTYAIKSDNTIWSWGSNFYGQLGTGNNTTSNVMVQTTNTCSVVAGINEAINGNSVMVYPNPSNGVFLFNINNADSKNALLEIYNLLGEKVYSTREVESQLQINLSEYPKGLYFVKLFSQTELYTQMIIVQ